MTSDVEQGQVSVAREDEPCGEPWLFSRSRLSRLVLRAPHAVDSGLDYQVCPVADIDV